MVQGVPRTWCKVSHRHSARCPTDMVQGVPQTWCKVSHMVTLHRAAESAQHGGGDEGVRSAKMHAVFVHVHGSVAAARRNRPR
jgi:hypothetical protein